MKNKPHAAAAKPAPTGRNNPVVTLDDVARAAGVSPSTVSRIINGSAIVSEAKTKAVAAAIAEMGFMPNPIARGLAGGRTLTIGVVTQAVDSPFYGAALRGVEDELAPAGYGALFVSGHWDPVVEARCIDSLCSRRVDGIVVFTGRLTDQALKAYARSVPVVVTGRTLKASGLFALNFDNFEGGRLATRHLIELGHRRIAFISGDPDHPDSSERFRGYRAALEEAGITPNPKLVAPGQYNEHSGLMAVDSLLHSRQKFSALFAANDQMALGAMLGLHRRSIRVPDDISVIGFDDQSHSPFAIPPLTTIHQPAYELGRAAAASMLRLLAGEKPAAVLPAPQLVVRESTRALGA